jgi:hypothetical protein
MYSRDFSRLDLVKIEFHAAKGVLIRKKIYSKVVFAVLLAMLFFNVKLHAGTEKEGSASRNGVLTPVRPLPLSEIIVRGNKNHPCVNITPEDVIAAKKRVAKYEWAKKNYNSIIKAADKWLKESDQYWLKFLPEKGACYAYGFTGCPICGSKTGTWGDANCSWDNPGHVKCTKGHVLPDAEHPDNGKGYVAPDGRTHYFVGQWNAWVTEQWRGVPYILGQAYLLTGDERYAERGLMFLDAMASIYKESDKGSWDYPDPKTSGRFARPLYQVARSLVIYADSYDFLYNSPAADKPSLRAGMTRRKNIEENMLLDGAYYCYTHSGKGYLTNGQADYMRGALAVGCLLDIPEYIDAAVKSPFSINVMLANNIDRDGRYYETSEGYAMHARNLYMTYAEPLLNLRNKEYPHGLNLYDDPRVQATITLPDLRFQLAGRRPNYGDCAPEPGYLDPKKPLFSDADYEFMEQLYANTSDKNKQHEYGQMLNCLAENNVDQVRSKYNFDWLLWHAREATNVKGELPVKLKNDVNRSWLAGARGVALLRQGDQAALLRYGPSIYHGHDDDLGLIYNANGYELSYEIGYGLASTHCQVGWSNTTISHGLVTVNEKNQFEGEGSGGSLLGFAALPSVQFADANSPLSYSKEGVKEYRRSLVLVKGGYLVDCFQVEGGNQHDYSFGSLGTSLEPFGVKDLKTTQGSLAEGYEWGEKIGVDGDINGYANKTAWIAPPGNGYGFFYNVRKAQSNGGTWGGTWNISTVRPSNLKAVWDNNSVVSNEHDTKLRLFMAGDPSEPVFANAPGLYPNLPKSSYVLARRSGKDLKSTFLAVYEPFENGGKGPAPKLGKVERIGNKAIAIYNLNGTVDVLLFGPHKINSIYGPIDFKGDFAYISGDGKTVEKAESLGAENLIIANRTYFKGKGAIVAKVIKSDAKTCTVELNTKIPDNLAGLTAIFSNPAWTRTSGYSIEKAGGQRLVLKASTLSLGLGNVNKKMDDHSILSDIPHEYTKNIKWKPSKYFDGKMMVGRENGSARITSIKSGSPMTISIEAGSTLQEGELFDYMDLYKGDQVRIALPGIWSSTTAKNK